MLLFWSDHRTSPRVSVVVIWAFLVRNTILWYMILVCCQASVFFPGCCWWTRHQCGLVPHDYAGNLLWLVCSNFPLISLHKKNSFRNSILFSECAAQRTNRFSCLEIFPSKMQQCAHINIHFNHYSYSEQILCHFCRFELFATPHLVVWSDFQVFWHFESNLRHGYCTEAQDYRAGKLIFHFLSFPPFLFLKGPCKSCALYLRSGVHCFTA